MDQIIDDILREKLIVIVRGVEREKLIPLVQAMYDGGIRLLELTYDSTGKCSDEQTAQNIELLCSQFGDRMRIGAGTVLTASQVELTKKAGGSFIISPDVDADVIRRTKEMGMVSIPGALTPTEVSMAHKSGADFVKLFPISALQKGYVKALRAPMPHIRLLAVGGVDENNMSLYLKEGICGFGIGSNIIQKELLAREDYRGLTELARRYTLAATEKK